MVNLFFWRWEETRGHPDSEEVQALEWKAHLAVWGCSLCFGDFRLRVLDFFFFLPREMTCVFLCVGAQKRLCEVRPRTPRSDPGCPARAWRSAELLAHWTWFPIGEHLLQSTRARCLLPTAPVPARLSRLSLTESEGVSSPKVPQPGLACHCEPSSPVLFSSVWSGSTPELSSLGPCTKLGQTGR